MSKMKKNTLLFTVFLLAYAFIFTLITYDKNRRVETLLHDELKYLQLSYTQGLDRFEVISQNIFLSIQNDQKVLDIISDLDKKGLKKTHEALQKHLQNDFISMQGLSVLGMQFTLPNNRSLLRLHKQNKYGDDLTQDRYSIDYVNKYKKHIYGLEQGKTYPAFRELYPLFKNGKYLGVVEVLFSPTTLQDYTMRASNIHTHFLASKELFKTKAWESDSTQHYLFNDNDHIKHQRLDHANKTIITPLREEINRGVASHKAFEVYKRLDEDVKVVSFFPVSRIKDEKVVAYFVSYSSSKEILTILKTYNILITIISVVFLLFYLVALKIIRDKSELENEVKYDVLTNAYSRRYFLLGLEHQFKSLLDHNVSFCIVMADIDFFKKVNDTYGHQYGDIVLQEVVAIFKESIRSLDRVGRYGGEEFLIFLLADATNSFKVIENIHEKIRAHEFGPKKIKVTVSFGIAEYKNDATIEAMVKRSDDALYKAKNNGRNQTQIL